MKLIEQPARYGNKLFFSFRYRTEIIDVIEQSLMTFKEVLQVDAEEDGLWLHL